MTETSELSIHEKPFVQSDKTDTILVVQGKKMHVKKELLSYHSDYFDNFFNSDQKSTLEFRIENVKFEDFATLLSLIQNDPIKIDEKQMENLLELAERFQLLAAKRHVELFMISKKFRYSEVIILADKYQLDDLMNQILSKISFQSDFYCRSVPLFEVFRPLSDKTCAKLFEKFMQLQCK